MFTAKTIIRLLQIVPVAVVSIPALAYDVIAVSGAGRSRARSFFKATYPRRRSSRPKTGRSAAVPRRALILVGPDKGVEDVVVYLKEVPKGKAWASRQNRRKSTT